jgi:hypothetical protein
MEMKIFNLGWEQWSSLGTEHYAYCSRLVLWPTQPTAGKPTKQIVYWYCSLHAAYRKANKANLGLLTLVS